jgi:hypothetical protein
MPSFAKFPPGYRPTAALAIDGAVVAFVALTGRRRVVSAAGKKVEGEE